MISFGGQLPNSLFAIAIAVQAGLLSDATRTPGHIEGVVRLAPGEELRATTIANTTDPEVCGPTQTLGETGRTIEAGSERRELEHVIVVIANPPVSSTPSSRRDVLTLDNNRCRFLPHVSVTTVDTELVATNSDAVLHTTHLYGPSEMNLSLPVQGVRAKRRLNRPGLYVVKCDIHGWMQAFIRVDDHHWHATSTANGEFRIKDVPEGVFQLEFWHERLGTVTQDVRVESGKTTRLEIELGAKTIR